MLFYRTKAETSQRHLSNVNNLYNIAGMEVKCPRCKKLTEYSDKNPYRPFCSQRCRDIDFGNWVEGNYALPGEKVDPTPQSGTDLSSQEEDSE